MVADNDKYPNSPIRPNRLIRLIRPTGHLAIMTVKTLGPLR